jgi:hypothetical protein
VLIPPLDHFFIPVFKDFYNILDLPHKIVVERQNVAAMLYLVYLLHVWKQLNVSKTSSLVVFVTYKLHLPFNSACRVPLS